MRICPLCKSILNRLIGPEGHKVDRVLTPWTLAVVEEKRMDAIHVCPKCEHCE